MAVPLACVRSLFKRGYIPALLIFGFANCCRGFAHVSHRHLVRVLFSDQHEPVAPAARRQQPMPLLGSNRASDLTSKAVPNLYVELRRSVLGVRVPEDIQMKGFGVKIGPNLDMGVPDVVQGAGGYRGSMAPQRPWGVEFAVGGSPW